MKKVFEGIRDLLYDYIDTILVIAIVVIVGGTIMWRLDILFASDLEKETLKPTEIVTDNEEDVSENYNDDEGKNDEDNIAVENEEKLEENDKKPEDDNNVEDTEEPKEVKTVVVEIPNGSLGPTIGDILIKKGLIDDKWEFLKRAQELGLDTKLKSGTFEIKSNSSLDIIIKTISRNL